MNALLQHGFSVFGQFVSIAELVGQIGALAVVFLAQRRNILTWPVQLAASILLFGVYLSAHLGGLAFRQVIVFAIAAYGLCAWWRRRDGNYGVAVRSANWTQRSLLLLTFVAATVAMALTLEALDASWSPWPDAAIFVGTAVAYFAQALRYIEFWLIWLVVDAIGVPLQLASGLWFSATIYLIFAVLVVRGWWQWVRSHRTTLQVETPTLSSTH